MKAEQTEFHSDKDKRIFTNLGLVNKTWLEMSDDQTVTKLEM
jgi:hypothetical protein